MPTRQLLEFGHVYPSAAFFSYVRAVWIADTHGITPTPRLLRIPGMPPSPIVFVKPANSWSSWAFPGWDRDQQKHCAASRRATQTAGLTPWTSVMLPITVSDAQRRVKP